MQISTLFVSFGHGLVFSLIAFLFIVFAKIIDDNRTTAFDDDYEIEEKGNSAVGFRRTGLYIAYAIAFAGTLSGKSTGFVKDIYALFIDGFLITFCLFVCRSINDRVMLSSLNNDEEIHKGNTAVGLAECGMYIATGFVLNGAFTGTSENMLSGIISALVFFVAGQVALLLCGLCYEIITPFNVRNEIKKGNAAAGTALAGILIALGVILRASIAGPTMGWAEDFLSFGLYTLYGIVLLLAFRKAIDKFLLPSTSIEIEVERDQNVAALSLTQAGIIAIAIVISSVM
ncbi:MAG: DUF350 domain-containing protein [Desulfobacterales bacterium]|nr:MAG: DUF350 domain-containing protein [Desulfobacterales bacterium]